MRVTIIIEDDLGYVSKIHYNKVSDYNIKINKHRIVSGTDRDKPTIDTRFSPLDLILDETVPIKEIIEDIRRMCK